MRILRDGEMFAWMQRQRLNHYAPSYPHKRPLMVMGGCCNCEDRISQVEIDSIDRDTEVVRNFQIFITNALLESYNK